MSVSNLSVSPHFLNELRMILGTNSLQILSSHYFQHAHSKLWNKFALFQLIFYSKLPVMNLIRLQVMCSCSYSNGATCFRSTQYFDFFETEKNLRPMFMSFMGILKFRPTAPLTIYISLLYHSKIISHPKLRLFEHRYNSPKLDENLEFGLEKFR